MPRNPTQKDSQKAVLQEELLRHGKVIIERAALDALPTLRAAAWGVRDNLPNVKLTDNWNQLVLELLP